MYLYKREVLPTPEFPTSTILNINSLIKLLITIIFFFLTIIPP